MSTNIKKYRVIISSGIWGILPILLLLLILVVGVNTCGQSTEKRSQDETQGSDLGSPSARTAGGHFFQGYERFSPSSYSATRDPASSTKRREQGLPSSEFGRENPFMPLVMDHASRSAIEPGNPESQTTGKSASRSSDLLDFRLTAIFVTDKPYAIIEENGTSRPVYAGDTVAGMRVVEINRGQVILSKGGKRQIMMLGVLPEAIAKSKS
jgi:hypothetical protein